MPWALNAWRMIGEWWRLMVGGYTVGAGECFNQIGQLYQALPSAANSSTTMAPRGTGYEP